MLEQFNGVFRAAASYYNLLKEAQISWQKAQPKNPRQAPDLVKKKNKKIEKMLTNILPDLKAGNIVVYGIGRCSLPRRRLN